MLLAMLRAGQAISGAPNGLQIVDHGVCLYVLSYDRWNEIRNVNILVSIITFVRNILIELNCCIQYQN